MDDVPLADRLLALALVVLSAWAVLALVKARPSRVDVALAALLAAGCLWWLFTSPAYEGPGILALTSDRGLTVADLGVPPGIFLATGVAVRARARDSDRSGADGSETG